MSYQRMISIVIVLITHSNAEVKFEIINMEPGPIWVGILGNPGHAHLSDGGFSLNEAQGIEIFAPDNWAGRFWARTWCFTDSNHCLTGDCDNKLQCNGSAGASPTTLIEVTLKGFQGLDYYDISLVEGFNIRAFIEPVGTRSEGPTNCVRVKCLPNANNNCPEELRVSHEIYTIACHSACTKFNTDQYCCRGSHNSPATCNSSTWPKDYPAYFKKACPDAYSYAYDDKQSTFTCKASHYRIQFG